MVVDTAGRDDGSDRDDGVTMHMGRDVHAPRVSIHRRTVRTIRSTAVDRVGRIVRIVRMGTGREAGLPTVEWIVTLAGR